MHARQSLVIVSHDFDALRTAAAARSASTFCSDDVQADRAARQPAGSGEDQQVPDDFRGAVGFTVNCLDLTAQLLREGAGGAQQLEVAEHALQRVVQLVRDAGDELAERGELLGLRQPLAQLLALGLEPRLRRQVARDDDAADRLPILVRAGR